MTQPRVIHLKLPIPPSSNIYWRFNKARGYIHRSNQAMKYREQVQRLNQCRQPLISDVSVTVRVYRERKSGDLDNFLKVLFDSLQGQVYVNDSQIIEIYARRYDDKFNPRVEVELRELNAVGELFPMAAAAEELDIPF